jgi:hypothetical protein
VNCAQTSPPSALLTKTVPTPAARARAAIASRLPPSVLLTYQIHMPLPANTAGSSPGRAAFSDGSAASAITLMLRLFERRPRPSRTVTPTVPSAVPAGTRTVQPPRERTSLVASAPRDQRKLTRMPRFRPRPCSWICLPTPTRTPLRQALAVTGTQRSPVSRGAFEAASAVVVATPNSASTKTRPQAIVARLSFTEGCNRRAARK